MELTPYGKRPAPVPAPAKPLGYQLLRQPTAPVGQNEFRMHISNTLVGFKYGRIFSADSESKILESLQAAGALLKPISGAARHFKCQHCGKENVAVPDS